MLLVLRVMGTRHFWLVVSFLVVLMATLIASLIPWFVVVKRLLPVKAIPLVGQSAQLALPVPPHRFVLQEALNPVSVANFLEGVPANIRCSLVAQALPYNLMAAPDPLEPRLRSMVFALPRFALTEFVLLYLLIAILLA